MKSFGKLLLQFLNYFKGWLIFTGVVVVAFCIFALPKLANKQEFYESTNTSRVHGNQRVFDYGNALTDEEEAKLEAYIHEAELECLTDIVVVTLNESLSDYAQQYADKYHQNKVTPDRYVMVYADEFWETNRFGYNCPQVLDGGKDTGDGVLLLDNLYREEETNKIYSWMCTTGHAYDHFSSDDIDDALDAFYDYVNTDYYKACIAFVDEVRVKMAGRPMFQAGPFVIGGIVALIFILTHLKSKAGKVTTNAQTYVVGRQASFPVHEDLFINKTVKRVYNPPSSSGGHGGGGHSSGGGGFHGGGGHSR